MARKGQRWACPKRAINSGFKKHHVVLVNGLFLNQKAISYGFEKCRLLETVRSRSMVLKFSPERCSSISRGSKTS